MDFSVSENEFSGREQTEEEVYKFGRNGHSGGKKKEKKREIRNILRTIKFQTWWPRIQREDIWSIAQCTSWIMQYIYAIVGKIFETIHESLLSRDNNSYDGVNSVQTDTINRLSYGSLNFVIIWNSIVVVIL